MANIVTTLYSDSAKTNALYPRTKASAVTDGNGVSVIANITTDKAIANGDKIALSNASNNGALARSSIAFDGSTTTQFLSKKGTWESVQSGSLAIDTSNILYSGSMSSAITYTATQNCFAVNYGVTGVIKIDDVQLTPSYTQTSLFVIFLKTGMKFYQGGDSHGGTLYIFGTK